jgi:hypothetical protein
MTSNFFSPLSFVAIFGSGMGKNQDPGSGINIPDPPHCQERWGSTDSEFAFRNENGPPKNQEKRVETSPEA